MEKNIKKDILLILLSVFVAFLIILLPPAFKGSVWACNFTKDVWHCNMMCHANYPNPMSCCEDNGQNFACIIVSSAGNACVSNEGAYNDHCR